MKVKVRLKTARTPVKGKPQAVGDVVSVDADEAVRLVESGQADPTDKGKYAALLEDYQKAEQEKRKDEATASAEAEAIALRREAEELLQKADKLCPVGEEDNGDHSGGGES
jgi:hypothetical protein